MSAETFSMSEHNAMVAGETSEAAFLEQVRRVASDYGWLPYHTHNSKRSEPGFPDLVLVRADRLVFAELKRVKGRISPDQGKWIWALRRAGREVYVWRPVDWDTIHEALR